MTDDKSQGDLFGPDDFDITRSHHHGNPESEAANQRLQPNKEETRLKILAFIDQRGTWGATADEIAAAWRCSHNHVAPRMSELLMDGRLVRSGKRRLTRTSSPAAVLVTRRVFEQMVTSTDPRRKLTTA